MTPHLSIAFDSARPVRPTRVTRAAVLQAPAKAPPPDLAGLLMIHLVLGLCAGLLIGTGLLLVGHAWWWMALLGYTSGETLVVACAFPGRVALVDPGKAGLGLTAFVAVAAQDHSPASQTALAATLAGLPEVLEIWRLAGEADYLLKVVTPDMAAFDSFHRRLTARLALKAVTSRLALERVSYSTALPIPDSP